MLLITACSASLSDKERVAEVYDQQAEKLDKEADAIVKQYSENITENADPGPYFNPTEPVPHYYAEKLDNWSVDLKVSQLNKCNAYNTRSTCMNGKLPVSPVCNPGIDSIVASIEPTKHKYYYFVADKNGKTYFNETDSGHIKTVNKLKSEGLWIEYQN